MANRPFTFGFLSTTAFLSVLAVQSPAYAQSNGREAQIVVDAQTNEVLYENNARELRRPASITKVMTLYLLFDALKSGRISWNDRISFSRNAANQPPTKLFVGAGNSISVQTAVEALILRSANDVATAVAENLGGSEANFAQMMTSKARELGMSSTTFRNASGLPDANQRTTAEDLAKLAIAIHRDFPDQYHWFSATQMSYNGQIISGHNHLIKRMTGMDGLKTGYTRASGFNLAATTQRNGHRVVTIVLGGANRFQRDDLVEALTESAYRELGIGATQFAMNPSGYQVNFRDARDAADAAALIMDLPQRTVPSGNTTAIAMNRSGRRIGFERGAPVFQVADMTRPTQRWPSTFTASQVASRDDGDDGATDEDEAETERSTTPTPVRAPNPAPFRVAVSPSGAPVRAPIVARPNAQATQTRVPVVFPPVSAPAPTPSVPLRQLAQSEAQSPTSAPDTPSPIITLPPNPNTTPAPAPARPPVIVFAEVTPALRGISESPSSSAEPASVEAPSTAPAPAPAPAATQMAEIAATAVEQATSTGDAPATPPANVQIAEITPDAEANAVTAPPPVPTQMAELARQDAAELATTPPVSEAEATTTQQAATSGDITGSINLAENNAPAGGPVNAPVDSEAQSTAARADTAMADATETTTRQVADAVALNQIRQAEASAREQARIDAAAAVEEAAEARRREAARVALAARQAAERQLAERRAAERLVAESRAKAQKEKEARELALAEREAARDRAVAAQAETRRQAEATRARNARGTAIVQVGAFKDRADAAAAIAQFARFFPSFADGQVSTVERRDGTWYRARFGGLGAVAAREACTLVLGRGGACAIVGD